MRKLSLCIIAGNVEKYITRFLDHFEPLADEIVVVRACGLQEPDGTMAIAESRGHRSGIYENAAGNDWPHVDDFAAARNMAFDMASHDLVMWADTDDMIDEASIALIKETIALLPDEFDGIEMPYHVPEDGLTVFRERIIRKGRAKWISPIHEHLSFDKEPMMGRITDGKILHAPSGTRSPNDQRNLRILESIPSDNRTTSHRFHLFQSLRAVGRIDDAVSECVSMLANPPSDMGRAEKYELYIAAGQLSPEPEMRASMILQALGTDPTRREAFGEMAMCMIALGRPADALGYTTAMRSFSQVVGGCWNARAKYYGWLGEQLHGMALRANGRVEEADAVETNHFIKNGAKISLVHATRGRVKMAVETRRKWLERAKNPDAIEHIFGIDMDDEHAMFLTVHNHVWTNGKGGPVAAWNAAAAKSCGKIIIQMSDDFDPPLHWDEKVIDAMGDLSKPSVLAVSDGYRTDGLMCMAILTRARYLQQGYLFHPDFFSMYSDNWFSECAWNDGVVIDAMNRITFEHLHPAFGKGELDETYARSNAGERYREGLAIMDRLQRRDDGVGPTGIFDSSLHQGQFDSPQLAAWLVENLDKSTSIIDLGCGNGFIVKELTSAGFNITGYEGDPIEDSHVKADLTQSMEFQTPGQTVCIEVGEHIPAMYCDTLIRNIATATSSGSLAVVSWATPGQPGRGHVNCLPMESVIEKFEKSGFEYLPEKTDDIRQAVDKPDWLHKNLIVFKKG